MKIRRIKKNKKLNINKEKNELEERGFQVLESSKRRILSGIIKLNNTYDAGEMYYHIYDEEFEIKIYVDKTMKRLPKVIEVSSKTNPKYHRYSDGMLCLGSNIELWQLYKKNDSIVDYIDNFIVPYFFRYCCIRDYGSFPVGEYSHKNGILEAYSDILGSFSKEIVIQILEFYLNNKNGFCPCKSGKKFRECHYNVLSTKINLVPKKIIKNDLQSLKNKKNRNRFKKFK